VAKASAAKKQPVRKAAPRARNLKLVSPPTIKMACRSCNKTHDVDKDKAFAGPVNCPDCFVQLVPAELF